MHFLILIHLFSKPSKHVFCSLNSSTVTQHAVRNTGVSPSSQFSVLPEFYYCYTAFLHSALSCSVTSFISLYVVSCIAEYDSQLSHCLTSLFTRLCHSAQYNPKYCCCCMYLSSVLPQPGTCSCHPPSRSPSLLPVDA